MDIIKIARLFAWPILHLLLGQVRSRVKDVPAGPLVIVFNHRSILDVIVAQYLFPRPIRFLAHQKVKDDLLGRILSWPFKPIVLQRGENDEAVMDRAALRRIRQVFAEGGVIGLFPESRMRRSNDPDLLPFKIGAVALARRYKAKLLAAAVTGTDDVWPSGWTKERGDALGRPRLRLLNWGATMTVATGQLFDPAEEPDDRKLTDMVRDEVARLIVHNST